MYAIRSYYVLFILPLIIQPTADFSGADSIAQDLISEVNAQYEPWFKPLWSPPSTEIESAIFAIQAAVGSGVLFFVLGYLVGKNKSITNDKEVEKKYSE